MPYSPIDGGQPSEPFIGQVQPTRGRPRLADVAVSRAARGATVVRVELEWPEHERVHGEARADASRACELRAAAQATLRAIEAFTGGELAFELLGVKVMRGFDAEIVMVSVALQRGGPPQRLLGCQLAEQHAVRGAVTATLHATNRVVGNYVASRSL